MPTLSRDREQELLSIALRAIEHAAAEADESAASFMINHVLEIDADGRCQLFQLP